MIVFFVFLFVFEPSKTFMTSFGDGCLIVLKKTELSAHENNFHLFVRAFELILFVADRYANSSDCRNFSEFLKY